jgi:hypothetical protein
MADRIGRTVAVQIRTILRIQFTGQCCISDGYTLTSFREDPGSMFSSLQMVFVVDEVKLEQIIPPSASSFPLLIVSPDQAEHYHTLGPKLGA